MKNGGLMKKWVSLVLATLMLSSCAFVSLAGAEGVIELTVWHHEPPAHRVKAWQGVIDDFMAKNPDIKVTQEVVLWGDVTQKILSAIRSGTLPDINQVVDNQWTTTYLANAIVPIDDIVQAVDEKEGLYQPGLKSYTYDGHVWALPMNCSTWNLMYRPSILEKAGFDRPPETWSELLEYAEKCTFPEEGIYGIGLASGRNGLTNDQYNLLYVATGNDYFDEEGNVAFDNADAIAAAEFYQKLVPFSSPASTGWGFGEIEMNFAAGNIAMTPYLSPNLPGFFEEGLYDVATAPMPAPDGMSVLEGNKLMTNHALSVTTQAAADPARYEAVKRFLMHVMEPEMIWMLTVGQEPGFFYPPTKTGMDLVDSGYINSEYLPLEGFDDSEGSEHRAILQNFADYASGIDWNGYSVGAKYGIHNFSLTEIDDSLVIADMMQKILVENMPAAEAVKWAHDKMVQLSEESASLR